ncbi:MAG: HEPN domain-containing protein [Deltaproteobacteria bacterium]|nr:HEPN domain-containing protein [Deltaproteobacteria bacterium]
MEKSLTAAQEFKDRALREIKEARSHLKNSYLESAVSTAYYSCFYAVHSQLARLGVEASSHKQAGIQFRRHFIKTKKLSVRFSEIWQKLSGWRMEVDYDSMPDVDDERAGELVMQAEEFVAELLKIL